MSSGLTSEQESYAKKFVKNYYWFIEKDPKNLHG